MSAYAFVLESEKLEHDRNSIERDPFSAKSHDDREYNREMTHALMGVSPSSEVPKTIEETVFYLRKMLGEKIEEMMGHYRSTEPYSSYDEPSWKALVPKLRAKALSRILWDEFLLQAAPRTNSLPVAILKEDTLKLLSLKISKKNAHFLAEQFRVSLLEHTLKYLAAITQLNMFPVRNAHLSYFPMVSTPTAAVCDYLGNALNNPNSQLGLLNFENDTPPGYAHTLAQPINNEPYLACTFQPEVMQALVQTRAFTSRFSELHTVRFQRYSVTFNTLQTLTTGLLANSSLTSLDLSYCKLVQESATETKEMSEENRLGFGIIVRALLNPGNGITHLNLLRCQLPNEAVVNLSGALTHPDCRVTTLMVSLDEANRTSRTVDTSGIKTLAAALRHPNCRLNTLKVSFKENAMGEGIQAFNQGIFHNNGSLTSLTLSLTNDWETRLSPEVQRIFALAVSCPLFRVTELRFETHPQHPMHPETPQAFANALGRPYCKLTSLSLFVSRDSIHAVDYGKIFLEALNNSEGIRKILGQSISLRAVLPPDDRLPRKLLTILERALQNNQSIMATLLQDLDENKNLMEVLQANKNEIDALSSRLSPSNEPMGTLIALKKLLEDNNSQREYLINKKVREEEGRGKSCSEGIEIVHKNNSDLINASNNTKRLLRALEANPRLHDQLNLHIDLAVRQRQNPTELLMQVPHSHKERTEALINQLNTNERLKGIFTRASYYVNQTLTDLHIHTPTEGSYGYPSITKVLDANKRIQARVVKNSGFVSIMMAFLRANQSSAIRDSFLPLLHVIAVLSDLESHDFMNERSMINLFHHILLSTKEHCERDRTPTINLNAFRASRYFRSQLPYLENVLPAETTTATAGNSAGVNSVDVAMTVTVAGTGRGGAATTTTTTAPLMHSHLGRAASAHYVNDDVVMLDTASSAAALAGVGTGPGAGAGASSTRR